MRAFFGGADVVAEVGQVDLFPDATGGLDGLGLGELRIAMEVRVFVAKDGFAEAQEAFDVPDFDGLVVGVYIYGEIEEVGDKHAGALAGGLEDVEAFEDEDVRLLDAGYAARDDVVVQVGVDGRADGGGTGFEVGEELEEEALIVAFGEAFALHEAAGFEDSVGIEEAVGGDKVDLLVVGPAGEGRAEDAGEGAFADGDAAGDADDVGDALGRGDTEELLAGIVKVLDGREVEVEEAGERDVDVTDFTEGNLVIDAAEGGEVFFAKEKWGGGAEGFPAFAIKLGVAAEGGGLGRAWGHGVHGVMFIRYRGGSKRQAACGRGSG